MNRILLAFRAFFALLFGGRLPSDLIAELGLVQRGAAQAKAAPATAPAKSAAAPTAPPQPQVRFEEGALQLLSILQREARALDFFMEDIAPYSDDQVAAAARDVHDKTREVLIRHFAPAPAIDAVEGTPIQASDPAAAKAKYVGNVPATGKPPGGLLRHRGWRAGLASLPKPGAKEDLALLAPPEIEVE